MKTNFIVILVTCASKREARALVDRLLKKRLIACANIIPGIDSKFWWKGKIDNAKEFLILMKTKFENFKAIEREIKLLHSYDVPEIIAIPIVAGSKKYLSWINDVTGL